MLNYIKTIEILEEMHADCLKFWEREGKEESEAAELAKKDIERLTTNPFSPKGEKLNEEAKHAFVTILEII